MSHVPKVIISGRGRIRSRLACRELRRPREGCLWMGALRASGGGAFWGGTEVGSVHLQQPGAWLSGKMPPPWGGRTSRTQCPHPCSSYFPSDSESPRPSPARGLLVPLWLCTFLPSPLVWTLWVRPGCGRPGRSVQGQPRRRRKGRWERGRRLQQGQSRLPPAAELPLTAEQPSPWLPSAFQGRQRSKSPMPAGLGFLSCSRTLVWPRRTPSASPILGTLLFNPFMACCELTITCHKGGHGVSQSLRDLSSITQLVRSGDSV